jgi:hypothetical protein
LDGLGWVEWKSGGVLVVDAVIVVVDVVDVYDALLDLRSE